MDTYSSANFEDNQMFSDGQIKNVKAPSSSINLHSNVENFTNVENFSTPPAYLLKNEKSGKCLYLKEGKQSSHVWQALCDDTNKTQQWTHNENVLRNVNWPEWCINSNQKKDGKVFYISPCNPGHGNQKITKHSLSRLRFKEKCIEGAGTGGADRIKMMKCHKNSTQRWSFLPAAVPPVVAPTVSAVAPTTVVAPTVPAVAPTVPVVTAPVVTAPVAEPEEEMEETAEEIAARKALRVEEAKKAEDEAAEAVGACTIL